MAVRSSMDHSEVQKYINYAPDEILRPAFFI